MTIKTIEFEDGPASKTPEELVRNTILFAEKNIADGWDMDEDCTVFTRREVEWIKVALVAHYGIHVGV